MAELVREGVVQLNAEGTGKRIRNIVLEIPQDDGSIQTVYTQVVGVMDENGLPLAFSPDSAVLQAILLELQAMRSILSRSTGQFSL